MSWTVEDMKRTLILLFCIALSFAAGCSDPESTETIISSELSERTTEEWMEGLESENGTYPITLPIDPEVSRSLHEAVVSEEESLNEQAARWHAVDDAMRDVLNSEEFKTAETDERKKEIVIERMKELALHGTEEFPEPLILQDSWVYYPEGKLINAKYYDGPDFSVGWYDYNAASTDVTE